MVENFSKLQFIFVYTIHLTRLRFLFGNVNLKLVLNNMKNRSFLFIGKIIIKLFYSCVLRSNLK